MKKNIIVASLLVLLASCASTTEITHTSHTGNSSIEFNHKHGKDKDKDKPFIITDGVSGYKYVTRDSTYYNTKVQNIEKTSHATLVVVDGVKFELRPKKGNNPQYMQTIQQTQLYDNPAARVSGKHLSYAHYGIVNLKKNDRVHVFAQGQTADLSNITTGQVKYNGYAFLHIPSYGVNTGSADFLVNFATKKLAGNINFQSLYLPSLGQDIQLEKTDLKLKIKATISGSNFHGSQLQSYNSKEQITNEVHGQFYGPKADELAGVFRTIHNNNGVFSGSFGAKAR